MWQLYVPPPYMYMSFHSTVVSTARRLSRNAPETVLWAEQHNNNNHHPTNFDRCWTYCTIGLFVQGVKKLRRGKAGRMAPMGLKDRPTIVGCSIGLLEIVEAIDTKKRKKRGRFRAL